MVRAAVPGGHPIIVPYDPAWPNCAAALIATLRERLGALALRVDHIGSTAVPGMAAKDVLDLQVSVADLKTAARAFDAALHTDGFRRLPYERDHVPAGRGDESALWAKRMWSRREHPDGDVNLHVRLAGSPNQRLALLFRDWLRAHPIAVPAYAAFKVALAHAVTDVDA
jgi:dephospho-CoA kinase